MTATATCVPSKGTSCSSTGRVKSSVYSLTGTGIAAGVPAAPSLPSPDWETSKVCREVPSVGSPSSTTPKPAFTGFSPDSGAVWMAATITLARLSTVAESTPGWPTVLSPVRVTSTLCREVPSNGSPSSTMPRPWFVGLSPANAVDLMAATIAAAMSFVVLVSLRYLTATFPPIVPAFLAMSSSSNVTVRVPSLIVNVWPSARNGFPEPSLVTRGVPLALVGIRSPYREL